MTAPAIWNHRDFGTLRYTVHKNAANDYSGEFGCPRRFKLKRDAEARGEHDRENVDDAVRVAGKTVAGTAVHETIAAALNNPDVCAAVLRGQAPTFERVRATFEREFERECSGRELEWRKDSADAVIEDSIQMVTSALQHMHRYVAAVELVEGAFICELEGIWLAGHIDLVYRPRSNPRAIAVLDWKSGMRPDPITLAHGWESGIYSYALRAAWFLRREQCELTRLDAGDAGGAGGMWHGQCLNVGVTHPSRFWAERRALEGALVEVASSPDAQQHARRFDEFPSEIAIGYLPNLLPYERAGSKTLSRDEDVEFYNTLHERVGVDRYRAGHKLSYKRGDLRGPWMLPCQRTERDVPRFAHRLRTLVGMVRMGFFLDIVGEHCARCPFQRECLNTGYAVRGQERDRLLRLHKRHDRDAPDP